MFTAGETLHIETNHTEGGYIQSHLFVIVLDIDPKNNSTIIIPIDTIRGSKHDKQTTLDIGCHEFITRNSYVNYRRAKLVTTDNLQNLILQGIAKRKKPCSKELLDRIRDGILKSEFTPMEIREIYTSYLFESI